MPSKLRTAIVGAGMTGLAAARRLVDAGDDVTIFDRDDVLGGLAASFVPIAGGDPLERYYHHIFRSDRAIVALAREVGLGDAIRWSRPQTVCFYDGGLYPLDSATSLLRFRPLPRRSRLRLAAALAILKIVPSARPFERSRSARWLRRIAGKRAYQVVFEPLFVSKFGRYAESVSLSWFWARIHDRTTELGYPRGGFHALYAALGDRLRASGATVRLGVDVTAIERHGPALRIRTNGGEAVDFDRVLVTTPLAVLASLAPGLGHDFLHRYGPGPSLGARCVVIALDRPLTGRYWINVCDEDAPFTVVVEQTALVGPERYGGAHLVYLGNYGPGFPTLPTRSLLASFEPFMRRLNASFDLGWIQDAWQFVAADAQPVVVPGYRARIAPHHTPIDGLFVANLHQVYPHDRGQNYAVRLADAAVRVMQAAI